MNSSLRYLPEGQGVLVGLEDPKDRVASVSETSPVFISISHGFYQQESVPSWNFGTPQQPVPQNLQKRGGDPILSLLWVHLSTPGPFLLHPLFPALPAPQLSLMPHPQALIPFQVCNYPPCSFTSAKSNCFIEIQVISQKKECQTLTLGP